VSKWQLPEVTTDDPTNLRKIIAELRASRQRLSEDEHRQFLQIRDMQWKHAGEIGALRALALHNQMRPTVIVYNVGVDMRYICDCFDSIARN
jgi:hypothetical protein